MDFLKEVLGEEMYGQFAEKVNAYNESAGEGKQIKIDNINSGNYVSKAKYMDMQTERDGLKGQLTEATETIGSYEKLDIDGIRKSVEEWKDKYEADTNALQSKIETQQKQFAAEKFIDGQRIKSPLSRKAILGEFMSQDFEFKDGAFVGAEDYMKTMKEKYPDEFEQDEPDHKKTFVRGNRNTHKPQTKSEQEAFLEAKYGKNKYYKQ